MKNKLMFMVSAGVLALTSLSCKRQHDFGRSNYHRT
jgi:hypothetical protein